MITIKESGMMFGPYDLDSIFHIEKSPYVTSGLSPKGIKVCEFIWRSPRANLYLIEAKRSVPNPQNSPEAYENYFKQIAEKFNNSIHIFAAGITAREESLQSDIHTMMAGTDLRSVSTIRFYLVIPDAPNDAALALTDKLHSLLKSLRLIWKAEAKVINRQLAQRVGLIPATS